MEFRDEGCGALKKSQEVPCDFATFCCICHYEVEEMSIAMNVLHIWVALLELTIVLATYNCSLIE